jgi:hypothetical protein
MKVVLLLLMAVAFVSGSASQGECDTIALFADTLQTSCGGPIPEDGWFFFHIFHYSAAGATGSRFRLPEVGCLAGNIGGYGWDYRFPVIGGYFSGVEFSYGECLTGWVYLGAIVYIDCCGLGGWGRCCEQRVEAHPDAMTGMVEAIDCSGTSQVAEGQSGFINIDDTCPCGTPTGIAERKNTWGALKALYRDSDE